HAGSCRGRSPPRGYVCSRLRPAHVQIIMNANRSRAGPRMNGGTDDVDLMGRFYDAALKHFGEPPLIAICDKRVVVPLDRLPEMVRDETGEELPASRLPDLVAAGWIPHLRDPSTGGPGYALYAPSRVGLFLKLERDGYSPAELRVFASYEEHQIDEIL